MPATTLLDDSMANFDAREANTHVLGEIESLQSNHFLDSDHVSSTLTLTRDARDDHAFNSTLEENISAFLNLYLD